MILILYQICFLDLLARFGRCAALLVVLLVGLCPSPSLIIATEATTSIGRLDRRLPQISLQLWHSRPSNTWNWWLLHEEGNQSWFPKSPMKSDKKHNQHLQVVNILVNNIFLTSVNDTGQQSLEGDTYNSIEQKDLPKRMVVWRCALVESYCWWKKSCTTWDAK